MKELKCDIVHMNTTGKLVKYNNHFIILTFWIITRWYTRNVNTTEFKLHIKIRNKVPICF